MLEINLPQALSELTAAFEAYEQALLGNDIEALNDLFWDSPRTVRYGVRELLYGHDAIAQFRRDRGPIDDFFQTSKLGFQGGEQAGPVVLGHGGEQARCFLQVQFRSPAYQAVAAG